MIKRDFMTETKVKPEYTGGSSSYYDLVLEGELIDGKQRVKTVKVKISCNQIIKALAMNYAQGNVFKAVWRICASKLGMKKRGHNTHYDAEKIVFFGNDMEQQERK
jgi:hypothetical protein